MKTNKMTTASVVSIVKISCTKCNTEPQFIPIDVSGTFAYIHETFNNRNAIESVHVKCKTADGGLDQNWTAVNSMLWQLPVATVAGVVQIRFVCITPPSAQDAELPKPSMFERMMKGQQRCFLPEKRVRR
jgi:hypothetical protein